MSATTPAKTIHARPQWLNPILWIVGIIVVVILYALSIRATQPDVVKLVTSAPKAKQFLSQLITPDLTARDSITSTIQVAFPIPCGSAQGTGTATQGSAKLVAEPACVESKSDFTLKGTGLNPNTEVKLAWLLPSGMTLSVKRITTDAQGSFQETMQARPIAATKDGKPAQLQAEAYIPSGGLHASQSLLDVVNAMFVTIFMALLATTAGTVIAAPFSFLAASNITRHGPVGTTVYYATRSVFNIIRSYEPLVMATIFALIVGFGSPFAGVLALVIVTTASLGKMFSEAVESIDPGPIEAITATGANRAQVILYAVVPQIIPDFLSFIIYHWDINVRISTIIGFVGGGGIGYYLSQRINSFAYHQAGTALLAIIIVVWVLDFLSSEVRKSLA